MLNVGQIGPFDSPAAFVEYEHTWIPFNSTWPEVDQRHFLACQCRATAVCMSLSEEMQAMVDGNTSLPRRVSDPNDRTAENGVLRKTRTNRDLAIVSALVGVLLLPVLAFVIQSDFVYFYHYASYALGLANPYEIRVRWSLPRGDKYFESSAQRAEFLERLPSEIKTKEDLSEWMIACLESNSPRLAGWALNVMSPYIMACIPHRSRIISLAWQYLDTDHKDNRRVAKMRLSQNSTTRIVLAKWAILLGIAATGVIAFKKAGKVSLKKPAIVLGIAQVVVPIALFGFLFLAGFLAIAGGDSGGISGIRTAVRCAKTFGNLCVSCLITGWAFAMWSLIARTKGSALSLLSLSRPVLLAVFINLNMLLVT